MWIRIRVRVWEIIMATPTPPPSEQQQSNAKPALRKPEFKKVDQLKPGTTGHTLVVKVVSSNTVLAKGRSVSQHLRHTRIAECLVGDETATIVFTARNEQGISLSHSFLFLFFYSIVSVWLLRKSEKWRCCLFCVEPSHIVVWIIKSSVDYKLLCAPFFFTPIVQLLVFTLSFVHFFGVCLFEFLKFFLCLLLIGSFFGLISEFLFLGLWKINAILMGIRILMIEIKYPL